MLGKFRRKAGSESGGSTVEFVIIFPVFVAAVFSTIEAGWLMSKSMMLDHGLDLSIRDLRLGKVTRVTADQIRDQICDKGVVFNRCAEGVLVELKPIASSADYPVEGSSCIDSSVVDDEGLVVIPEVEFNPGSRSELMFVRVCAAVDPIFPGIGLGLRLPKNGDGTYNLVSTAAFVNEPE